MLKVSHGSAVYISCQIVPKSVSSWTCHLLSFLILVEIFLDSWENNIFKISSRHFGYYVMRLRILFKSSVIVGSSDTTPLGEGWHCLVTARWEWKSKVLSWSPLKLLMASSLIRMEVLAPHLAFSDTTPVGEGQAGRKNAFFQLDEGGSLGSPLNLCWQGGGGAAGFPVAFGCSRPLLSKSFQSW